jgi:hypothetical protein
VIEYKSCGWQSTMKSAKQANQKQLRFFFNFKKLEADVDAIVSNSNGLGADVDVIVFNSKKLKADTLNLEN